MYGLFEYVVNKVIRYILYNYNTITPSHPRFVK